MIWLPMAGHSLTSHTDCRYKCQQNISVDYFHVLTCINYTTKGVMYFNMAGSEMLKCDYEVTEVIK